MPRLHRLDGIKGANDLVKRGPDILAGRYAPIAGKIGGREEAKFLAEVRLHFGHPLRDESLRRDDQNAPSQAAQLEFAHDESGLDGFAQADFIGEQEADTILRDGTA